MKPGEFYRVPKQNADEYPVVEGTRCVSVRIPDDDSFLPVLAAVISGLGETWSSVGTLPERAAYAQMWQVAYSETDWEGCMNCDDVADCIETSENVQDAINNVYNQYGTGVPMPTTVTGGNLYNNTGGCNEDELWGAISELVDSMNRNNVDAFEVTEVATNLAERVALLFSAIPIVETLPIDEAINYVQGLWTDDLFEAYNANDTEAYTDTLKCDLFCIALNNGCVLSLDDTFNYFMGRISGDASDTLAEVIAYITTGTWVGTEINDTFFAGQLLFMKYGNQFFAISGIRPFQMYLNIGKRNPSSEWMEICDDCPSGWCKSWDFTVDDGGWEIVVPGNGVYVPSVGFEGDDVISMHIMRDGFEGRKITLVTAFLTGQEAGIQLFNPGDGSGAFKQSETVGFEPQNDASGDGNFNVVNNLGVRVALDGIAHWTGVMVALQVCGDGEEPDWD